MLNVMTLNLNYNVAKHGPWPARREIILAAIEAAQPDMLALQAVEQEPLVEQGRDQAAQLAARLPGYRHMHYQAAMNTSTGGTQGSALLARIPMAEMQSLPLTLVPNPEDPNRRVLLAARFDLPSGPLYLIDAHFSWVADAARLNVQETVPFVNGLAGRGLLVGDLNNPPSSGILQPFIDMGWTDIWAELHPGKAGPTFESNDPTLRIDYAWTNRRLEPQVRGIHIIANQPDASGHRASDHFGLLVTLDL